VKTKIAISSWGNVGKAIAGIHRQEEKLDTNHDMELVGIIRRYAQTQNEENIPVVGDVSELAAKPDIILCAAPSHCVIEDVEKYLRLGISTVDCFDDHKEINKQRERLNLFINDTLKIKAVSIIGSGWDPGFNSIQRSLAGLVAATYLRGVAWIAVPTSVLGLVDAAVGGKTGIDLPEGKNLVGAFWEPRAVLGDLDLMAGLPDAEVRSGFGEVLKAGFIADPAILDLVSRDIAAATTIGSAAFAESVARAVQVKADVVADDLRERTSVGDQVGREALNYGHTLGHAIEAHEHYTWRHGEAISVGMVFVAELAARTVGLDQAVVARHRQVLEAMGLPTTYSGASFEAMRALMARDKKARGATLRFVVLRAIGQPTILLDPPEDALRAAYAAIASE